MDSLVTIEKKIENFVFFKLQVKLFLQLWIYNQGLEKR